MGKTYSCPFEGCDMVFSREYQLKKHKVTHVDPQSLFYCRRCPFYTLDARNLEVHIATHTGEKKLECPDTISVRGPSGSIAEERCKYRTNDRSLLTKHRTKVHGYIPRPRAAPRHATTFAFVPYSVPSSSAATSKATSRDSKPVLSRVQKRNAILQYSESSRSRLTGKVKDVSGYGEDAVLDSSLPSTSQEGVDEHERWGHAESLDAVGSSSVGSSSATSSAPNKYISLDAHGQGADVESPDATGTLAASSSDTISDVPNDDISLDAHEQSADVESSHAADSSNTTPVAPNQGISTVVLFDPVMNFDWTKFYVDGFTAPSVTGAHNPVSNPQSDTFATGSFGMNIGLDGPGMEGWDESDWDNLWARHN